MHVLLMYSTHTPSPAHRERLASIHPSLRVAVAENESTAIESAGKAEVMFGHRYLRQCLPYARHLRWVQSTANGVDRLPCAELARRGVLLTRMTVSSPVIARHALTLAWALTRRLPEAWQRQSAGLWDNSFDWLPFPRRALVLGTGSIGRALAGLLSAEGVTVTGIRRSASDEAVPGFERVYGSRSWREVLPEADWCFLALPYTPQTHGLFDESAMRSLPRHAILVNVGRGETLVTADLCRVLSDGHLGGAALDVVHPKPTGPEDPLWQTPGLLITPHVAAHEPGRGAAVERFCEEQLARFMAGQSLLDVVDLQGQQEHVRE